MIFALLLSGVATVPQIQLAEHTRANRKTQKEMVYVSPGEFTRGDNTLKDASPAHQVFLDGYWIGKNLVTVGDYREFCNQTSYAYDWAAHKPRWGYQEDFPMLYVSWDDSVAYARWAGGDLPTEAQWEKAAKGTTDRKYPWGITFDPKVACSSVGTRRRWPTDVGQYPKGASPFGCLDMAGNAAQWCKDWYKEGYLGTDSRNPVGPAMGTERVAKGGNWFFRDPQMFQCAYKGNLDPSLRLFGIGFRICVKSLD